MEIFSDSSGQSSSSSSFFLLCLPAPANFFAYLSTSEGPSVDDMRSLARLPTCREMRQVMRKIIKLNEELQDSIIKALKYELECKELNKEKMVHEQQKSALELKFASLEGRIRWGRECNLGM